MTFKLSFAAAVALAASPALATPYCAALLEADALERRYQRLAPILSSEDTGWIFGSDQFHTDLAMSETETRLMADLARTLAARGTTLAVWVAPPRPIVAGQAVLDATQGDAADHDVDVQAEAFNALMTQLVEAGAIAPNLLDLALSSPALQSRYYFQRDTHWTNIGAAHSALALAAAVAPGAAPGFDVAGLTVLEDYQESGSLSRIVEDSCGVTPTAELSPLYDYSPYLPQAADLFSDAPAYETPAVLVGTSFSDRNQRDQYQAAEALSAALGMPVANHSISGGGMVGPFEAYVLSGQFAEDTPELLVWEFPYTYRINEAILRQMLGALAADAAGSTETLAVDGLTFDVPAHLAAADALGLRMEDGRNRELVVYLHLTNGERTRLKLGRKSRVTDRVDLDTYWIDLGHLAAPIQSMEIEVRQGDVTTIEPVFLTRQTPNG